ncbi:hypothetical protein PZ938_14545 [Luteipulveratus sp. YIM 133132]|uniref:hypothetical protein n=1 Tax=Luteipulveratus flavus TaxID=3031728 RepID=UPI0023B01780|nr:hypothetical protein [Luteipulveratus sp. YIM 133132]MDE9366831.1 hypothetical protein [Luteipulveratus sp. YIM 133132]
MPAGPRRRVCQAPDCKHAYIADPGNVSGNNRYWLWFDEPASLIPPNGRSA